MKWIVFLFVICAAVWVYFNVDFANLKSDTTNTIMQEKTLKKFFDADNQNKEETQKVIHEDY